MEGERDPQHLVALVYTSSRRVGAEVLRRIVEGGEIGGRERCSIRAGENAARMHFARSVLINSAATSRLPLLPTRFN
jgi:hypothetical protein